MDAPHARRSVGARARRSPRGGGAAAAEPWTTTPRRCSGAGDGAARDRGGAWLHTHGRAGFCGDGASPARSLVVAAEREACGDLRRHRRCRGSRARRVLRRSLALAARRADARADECACAIRAPAGRRTVPHDRPRLLAPTTRAARGAPHRAGGSRPSSCARGCSAVRAAGPWPDVCGAPGIALRPPLSCRPRRSSPRRRVGMGWGTRATR